MNRLLRVLIVEDSVDDAALLSAALGQGGFEPMAERVETAESMSAALRRQGWDVVIADYTLPRFSALDALDLLKGAGLDLPFIIVSGTISEEMAVKAMKAGAHDYVIKGNLGRLVPAIEREIRDAAERQGRKRTEEALWESQARLAGIIASAMDGIITIDSEQRIVLFNTAAERMFKCSAVEVIGQRIERFLPERLRREHDRHLQTFEQSGITNGGMGTLGVISGLRADGKEFPIEASISQIEAAGQKFHTVILRDITERTRAEEAILETSQQLHTIVHSSPLAIVVLDRNGAVLLWNPAAERIFGWTEAEVLGQPNPVAPADEGWDWLMKVARKASGGETMASIEAERRRKDGSVVHINTAVAPLPGPHGEFAGMISVMADVTARKRAEQDLRRTSDRLQRLSRKLLEIQETERRRIARELHDEIGQALTATKINLQALQRYSDPVLISKRLGDAVGIVDRLLKQVRDMSLDLRPPLLDDLGLSPALKWYVEQQAQRAGLDIRLVVEEESVPRLDPAIETACFRVAQEALNNVLRHARATTATVELRVVADQLCLIVRDDGVGLDLSAVQQRAERGASLGWLGMQERVALTGGELQCDSSPGQGTQLSARFPLTPAPSAQEN